MKFSEIKMVHFQVAFIQFVWGGIFHFHDFQKGFPNQPFEREGWGFHPLLRWGPGSSYGSRVKTNPAINGRLKKKRVFTGVLSTWNNGDGTSSAQTTIQLAARIFGKSMVGDHGWPFSIRLSGGTMPSPSWIKNSGWSRFLAAWKIRVFYRRLLPRRTINSINISQVCEALCRFMRCFFVRSDNWHKIFTGCVALALLNSNSDLTPRCRQRHKTWRVFQRYKKLYVPPM